MLATVDIYLPDGDIGNGAGDGGTDSRLLKGELICLRILADNNKIGREGLVVIDILSTEGTHAKEGETRKGKGFAPKGLGFHDSVVFEYYLD